MKNLVLRVILKLLASKFLVITVAAAITATLVVAATGTIWFLLTESGVITLILDGSELGTVSTTPEDEQPAREAPDK